MKRILNILVIVIALAALGCSEVSKESQARDKTAVAKQVVETTNKNFTLTFNEGLEKAATEKKNMIVDFYTDWCHWCKVMDEKTFNADSVAKKLSDRFVTVRINAENPNESATFKGRTFNNIELTRAFGVTGFPSIAFISPEHEVITVMPGYIQAEQFSYILDYVDQKCWEKKMSLEEFIKKQGECDSLKTQQADSE